MGTLSFANSASNLINNSWRGSEICRSCFSIFLPLFGHNYYCPSLCPVRSLKSTFISNIFKSRDYISCISESCNKLRINLNFYFDIFLWCFKRFYEDLYGTFYVAQQRSENKNLG